MGRSNQKVPRAPHGVVTWCAVAALAIGEGELANGAEYEFALVDVPDQPETNGSGLNDAPVVVGSYRRRPFSVVASYSTAKHMRPSTTPGRRVRFRPA